MNTKPERRKSTIFVTALIASLMVVLSSAGGAWALTFSVAPVRIFLSNSARSETLTLLNQSEEPVSFQLSGFEWHQNPDGTMALTPTEDLIFFPVLLTLQPGDQRKVRVGVNAAPGAFERTYRLFVEEIAPFRKVSSASGPPSVHLLTKMGLPIFVAPLAPSIAGEVENIGLAHAMLTFGVRNRGTSHFTVQKISVAGTTEAGTEIFKRETSGWYVLAAENRIYELPIPERDCARIRKLAINVETETTSFSNTLSVLTGSCTAKPDVPTSHSPTPD